MPFDKKNPNYEPGMEVLYDAPCQRVILHFRGRVIVLPGTYDDEGAGRLAGEQHCRRLGWIPVRKKPGHFRSAWY